jgi:hypothetical protein
VSSTSIVSRLSIYHCRYSLGNSAAPPPVHDLESGVAGAALEAAKDPKLRAAAIDVAQKNPELAAEALKAAAKYARKV